MKKLFTLLLLATSLCGSNVWADETITATFGGENGDVPADQFRLLDSRGTVQGATKTLSAKDITITAFGSGNSHVTCQTGGDARINFQKPSGTDVPYIEIQGQTENIIITQVEVYQDKTTASVYLTSTPQVVPTNDDTKHIRYYSFDQSLNVNKVTLTNNTNTNPNLYYIIVTYVKVEEPEEFVEFSGSFPYTWNFTTDWGEGVTAEWLNQSSYWGDFQTDDVTGYTSVVNQINIDNEYLWTGNSSNHPNLSKTYGLKFICTKEGGTAKRIRLYPLHYVHVQNGVSIVIPGLKAGQKVTIELESGSQPSTLTNAELTDNKYVVSSDGDVTFAWSSAANITKIKVERATPRFADYAFDWQKWATDGAFNYYFGAEKNLDASLITVTSNNQNVLNVTGSPYINQNDNRNNAGVQVTPAGAAGIVNLTFFYSGDNYYEPANFTSQNIYVKQYLDVYWKNTSVNQDGSSVFETLDNNRVRISYNPTNLQFNISDFVDEATDESIPLVIITYSDGTTKTYTVRDTYSSVVNGERNGTGALAINNTAFDIGYVNADSHGGVNTIKINEGFVCERNNTMHFNAELTLSFTIDPSQPVLSNTSPLANATDVPISTNILLTSTKVLDGKEFSCILRSTDGTEEYSLKGHSSNKNILIYNPNILSTNKTYQLVINEGDVKSKGGYSCEAFTSYFTTISSVSGNEPTIASSNPTNNATNVSYDLRSVSIVFAENITLVEGSLIDLRAVNGHESVFDGHYYSNVNEELRVGATSWSLDGKTVSAVWQSEDQVKYDVSYMVIFPVGSVIGTGGKPNSQPLSIKFRMQPNSAGVYSAYPWSKTKPEPFTWDFTKFGLWTDSRSSSTKMAGVSNKTSGKNCWYTLKENGIDYWGTCPTSNTKYPQGLEIQVLENNVAQNDDAHKLEEFKYLRVSLMKNNSLNNRLKIGFTEDGLESVLRFSGNTHYMTVPQLKAGQILYILARPNDTNCHFTINSGNARFIKNANTDEAIKAKYLMSGNEDELGNMSKGEKVYIVEMLEEGDLTFAVADIQFKKMAFSVDSKTLIPYTSGVAYATDCQSYPVEYSLTNDFQQGEINGLYITTDVNGDINSSSTKVTSSIVQYAAGVERNDGTPQGTIVMATVPNDNGEYVFPYFTTDCNTKPDEEETILDVDNSATMKTNCLVGVIGENEDYFITLDREVENDPDKINYVFTATRYITDQSGNLSYMEPKHLKKWDGNAPEEKGGKYFIYDTDENEYEVMFDNGKYYLVDEQGNKKLRTVSYSNPTFQPVLINNLASGDPNLSDDSLWQLPNHSSYLVLDLVQNNVNSNILLDGIVGEELDGIETIAVNNGVRMETDGWYTLYGVKLAGTPTEKGIYIYNNKKVLIK